jgi:hypothetical protein
MLLSGRTSLTLDELKQVASSEANIAGTAEELTEALVQRTMLEQAEGNYAFTHRIVGDGLAAERLAQIGPTPEILDAVSPSVTAEVRGVRSEWLIPITFLCQRDGRWRAAIIERDPLAAARSTPTNETVESRRWAAVTIWRQYVEWKIWINRRFDSVPALLDDGQVLASLLKDEELADVLAEVESGLGHESEVVRSNALEVMSAVLAE